MIGAGARLNKHKYIDEPNKTNWRDRDNREETAVGDWGNKPKSGNASWNDVKKTSKPNKGWEHDDRFQTDYS